MVEVNSYPIHWWISGEAPQFHRNNDQPRAVALMVMELGETYKSVYSCVSIYQSKIIRVYSGKLTWIQIWLSSFGAFF